MSGMRYFFVLEGAQQIKERETKKMMPPIPKMINCVPLREMAIIVKNKTKRAINTQPNRSSFFTISS